MAARSVEVFFENYLDSNLNLVPDSQILDHGIWITPPPFKIPKAQSGVPGKGSWNSESDGFATGTEGYCTYAFYDSASEEVFYIKIHWNNPFAGSSGYDIVSNNETINVSYSGGAGDNATVTFKAVKQ